MNIKSYENIACIDFVNVIIAWISHTYEKKQQQRFELEFIEKYVSFMYNHISIILLL